MVPSLTVTDEDRYSSGGASVPLETFAGRGNYDPIAVVGLSLRFPEDADSVEGFWNMLLEGRCVSQKFPADRMSLSGMHHPDGNRHDTISLEGGHFLKGDVTAFDAPFFSISSAEAASMDPQQRLLLETVYRALENGKSQVQRVAGIPTESIENTRTSVFAGSFTDDYSMLYRKDVDESASYAATGTSTTLNANRVSWFYDLRGPSVNVDTACSSSLVALDLACRSLHNGDSNMGIVTGSNLLLGTELFMMLSDMNMLSPDSRCWSFDERGNGYGRGEGVGVLVLKKVSDAIRDGDTIRGVVRATGTNQDGFTPGITQPNQASQRQLIEDCYRKAGLNPCRTEYFEAHGTGTPVGDPIEANALGTFFRRDRDQDQPLYVGAVKSNIGHLEGASGVAGVIKAILVLESGIIPPNANLSHVNPRIDEGFFKIKFPRASLQWPTSGLRRASINSFGFGGSNAHAVIDDAYNFLREHNISCAHTTAVEPLNVESSTKSSPFANLLARSSRSLNQENTSKMRTASSKILVFTSVDTAGVSRIVDKYETHIDRFKANGLGSQWGPYLDNLAYTLATRRTLHLYRAFALADTGSSSAVVLKSKMSKPIRAIGQPKIAFVFTGQGAQWAQMGKDLHAYRVFARTLQRAEIYLQSLGCQWPLIEEMMKPSGTSRINEPALSQPLTTALQIAFVNLLRAANIQPHVVLGHSSGEIAAAYCAGAISENLALRIAYMRGRWASTLVERSSTKGAMMAVSLSPQEVQPYFDTISAPSTSLTIACYNSSKNITVSGEEWCVDKLRVLLDNDKIFARKLKVDVAYHSLRMREIADEYKASIGTLEAGDRPHTAPVMMSSVTGNRIALEELGQPAYWIENLVSPVRFVDAIGHVCSKPGRKKIDRSHLNNLRVDLCIEVGPHCALRAPIRDILSANASEHSIKYIALMERQANSVNNYLQAVGNLFCLGYPVDLFKVNHGETKKQDLVSLNDLPEYPFDHSKTFWHEGRISRENRLRQQSKLDLLGKRVSDWNPFEARWRHFLRLSELPWIQDHKINGTVLFPAAGMLVMAIEALRQLNSGDRPIIGFELQGVDFHTALAVPSSPQGIETAFTVRQLHDPSIKGASFSDFRLYTYVSGQWIENCRGSARAVLDRAVSEVDGGLEDVEEIKHLQWRYSRLNSICDKCADPDDLYLSLQSSGFGFGPTFQSILQPYYSDAAVCTDIKCFRWESTDGSNPRQQHTVHPCTLDGLLQLALVCFTEGGKSSTQSLVPTHVQNLWVSANGLSWPQNDRLKAAAEVVSKDNRGAEVQAIAFSEDRSHCCVRMDGARFAFLEGMSIVDQNNDEQHPLWHLSWKADPSLMTPLAIQDFCQGQSPCIDEHVNTSKTLEFVMYTFLDRMVRNLPQNEILQLPSHFERYLHWAQKQIEAYRNDNLLDGKRIFEVLALDEPLVASLCNTLANGTEDDRRCLRVGKNLAQIISGQDDISAILSEPELRSEKTRAFERSMQAITSYLTLFSDKYPGARYLELRASCSGLTPTILHSLLRGKDPTPDSLALYSEYVIADSSQSSLETAKNTFIEYRKLQFRHVSVEQDLTLQGLEEKTYDCVILMMPSRSSEGIKKIVQSIEKVLQPGGKLIVCSPAKQFSLRSGFIGGLTTDWCHDMNAAEAETTSLTIEDWSSVLRQNNYHGVEADFTSRTNNDDFQSTMLTASKQSLLETKNGPAAATIIFNDISTESLKSVETLQGSLIRQGARSCTIKTLREADATDNSEHSICIFVDRVHEPLLPNIDDDGLKDLKDILTQYRCIVWVSLYEDTEHGVLTSMVDGFARAISNEEDKLRFVTITLESSTCLASTACYNIASIALKLHADPSHVEPHYRETEGIMHVSRVIAAPQTNKIVQRLGQSEVSETAQWSNAPPLKLTVGSPGILSTLHFREDDTRLAPLAEDEIEIKVHAVGLNFKDCLIALGRVSGYGLGNECSGIVTRVGTASAFQIGQRVCMSTTEAFKTYARSNVRAVSAVPEHMSFVQAAAVPAQFVTAWTCVVEIGRLQEGESILIHAGAGGTGQAAIQIAQNIGASVFTTVSSLEKKRLLVERYGVDESHILYSRDTTFAKGIKRLTDGRGVDVVLNSLSGESLIASWNCVASYGRFVEIGKRDILANSSLPMLPFNRGVTFSAFDGSIWARERPQKAQQAFLTVMDKVSHGIFQIPAPLHVETMANVQEAFRLLADGGSSGKIVVKMQDDTSVPATLKRKPTYEFDSSSTYVIAGGLGGVGRTIARWMATRGAKHLVLLSRSGASSSTARELVQELEGEGVAVKTPCCDITNPSAVKSVIEDCKSTFPRIRGCIQASMVLEDILFKDMSLAQWQAATKPKVQGSWNLHHYLSRDLTFFILFSSVSGIIGQRGQSNYAAGNTYLDALARHRVRHGEPAVSIDLGAIVSDGYLAENKSLQDRLLGSGSLTAITRKDIFALLEHYCDPALGVPSPDESQVVTGIAAPQHMRLHGHDPPDWMHRPLFGAMHQMPALDGSVAEAQHDLQNFRAEFLKADSTTEAADVAARALIARLQRSLSSLQDEDIDLNKPVHSVGVDSLLAAELRSWIVRDFQADVPIFEMLGGASFATVGVMVAMKSLLRQEKQS